MKTVEQKQINIGYHQNIIDITIEEQTEDYIDCDFFALDPLFADMLGISLRKFHYKLNHSSYFCNAYLSYYIKEDKLILVVNDVDGWEKTVELVGEGKKPIVERIMKLV